MSKETKVAVIGASGYTGMELLRMLLNHPSARLCCVTSRQNAGKTLATVFPRFRGNAVGDALSFVAPDVDAVVSSGAEIVFLALPHGVASEFAVPLLERELRVIDLSADFRLNDAGVYEEFYGAAHPAPALLEKAVYGLPELYGKDVCAADLVASPGCYPTSILVPLVPLVRAGLVEHSTICVASMSGVSGAGRKESIDLLFVECNESVRAYGAPKHRHLSEIEQELSLAAGEVVTISFTPHLIPVSAGIFTTTYAALKPGTTADAIGRCLEDAYGGAPFVRLLGEGGFPDTKNVTRSNRIDIGWVVDGRTGRLVLMSAEDNLGKGAATQAIQSFNLMSGADEAAGLENF